MDESTIEKLLEFSEREYLRFMDVVLGVANVLEGKEAADPRQSESQYLALKLFNHASSALRLYQGNVFKLPISSKQIDFIDIGSIAVVLRAALDAYLTFYEIYVLPNNDDEFEFAYSLWHIAGFALIENKDVEIPVDKPEFKQAAAHLAEMRERIQVTTKYQGLSIKERKEILKGVRKRDWATVLTSAGLRSQIFRMQFVHQSGHTHADARTSSQLMNLRTKEEQADYAQTELTNMLMIMAKFVLDYAKLHKESMEFLARNSEISERMVFWSKVASGAI